MMMIVLIVMMLDAVCAPGTTPSQDGSTCISNGVVTLGQKLYNDPQVQAGVQQTQVT
jgi:hypothetical protein